MAYVAVKGGQKAISESSAQLKLKRIECGKSIDVKDVEGGMRLLVDQVMSEASLYDKELAALAIKQGEGSNEEAVFLLRAYRSTLPRKYYSTCVNTNDMIVRRRISAAFKDIPGGQVLGASYDYVHRLIDFDLLKESNTRIKKYVKAQMQDAYNNACNTADLHFEKVTDYLRRENLLPVIPMNQEKPVDITKKALTFPTVRSERLQILTRGMTQAVISLGYASLRGYGVAHPTVAELRVGDIPIEVEDPFHPDQSSDNYYIGEIEVTEVESLIPVTVENEDGTKSLEFTIGYGITLGQNESKAIAMSILDYCLESDSEFATSDEEFVLYHIDAVEATGFISHLKLPHYVTFQSKLNMVRKTKGV